MNAHEMALEITRLKIRCEIHEALLAKTSLAMWLTIPGTSTQEALTAVLSEFEAIAEAIEKNFYSSEKYASFTDSEKALYADELREIVDHMKSYVTFLTKGK